MMQAFGGGRSQQRATHLDDDEEIIDTTKPEFAKAFKGFINEPGQRNVPTRLRKEVRKDARCQPDKSRDPYRTDQE
jgi:hypothetical protein